MRLENFDSEWHFVPDRPEAIRRFRRTNRFMILFFAVFVLGVFVALMVTQPVRDSVTATHYGSPAAQKAKSLGPQHATAPAQETR
jgi:hypothetical protein